MRAPNARLALPAAALAAALAAAAAVSCSSPSAPDASPEPAPPAATEPAPPPATDTPVAAPPAAAAPLAPETRQVRARAALRRNRLYDGAPPMIPHADKDYAFDQCLECHGPGDGAGGELVAAPTPHPELLHCRSCHVPLIDDRSEFRPSDAEPFTWPAAERMHDQAPWTIPHPVVMRESCLLCHTSPNLAESYRTTHPERRVCTQCHVPADPAAPGARPRGAWTGGPPRPKDD